MKVEDVMLIAPGILPTKMIPPLSSAVESVIVTAFNEKSEILTVSKWNAPPSPV